MFLSLSLSLSVCDLKLVVSRLVDSLPLHLPVRSTETAWPVAVVAVGFNSVKILLYDNLWMVMVPWL